MPSPPDIEVISVEIGTNHDSVLCFIYLPPDSPVSLTSSLVLYLSSHIIGVFLLEILISRTSIGHPSLVLPCHLLFSVNLSLIVTSTCNSAHS